MIEFKIKISEESIQDLFVTAIEGGSNYWYFFGSNAVEKSQMSDEDAFSMRIWDVVMNKGELVHVHDIEDPDGMSIGMLERGLIINRLQKLIDEDIYTHAFKDLVDENMDANSADILFQYIALGDVVYG